jgi:hypothetical protein
VLLTALDPGLFDEMLWKNRVRWVEENPEALDRTLAREDGEAGRRGATHIVLFDALEHLHDDRMRADKLVGGVLRLALDLRTRTRNIRAKVFIRHDMLESGLPHAPDVSKLLNNAADITWTDASLYGLFFHRIGNAVDDNSRDFRSAHPRWHKDGGTVDRYDAPSELRGDRDRQKEVFVEMAGPYMGANHRKGHTYTWLPNHLMDGRGQVSPRSFLSALTVAARETEANHAGHGYALHYDAIRRGVQAASIIRVAEMGEDIPWVSVAGGLLAGIAVPAELDLIVDQWGSRSLGDELARLTRESRRDDVAVRTGPMHPDDYPKLVDELVALGVVTRRRDGRVDLPDVYRIAFNIGRRGGVPRLKA